MELNSIGERVLVDRLGVGGALAHRLAVGLAGSSDVRPGDRGERDKLDGVDLDLTGADPVAAACLTRGRFHSRTESVMSPPRTSLRNSRLNSMTRTPAGRQLTPTNESSPKRSPAGLWGSDGCDRRH